MLKNLMEDKRLDLDRPLLSVRRFACEPESKQLPAATASAAANPNPRRPALPFYKPYLNSGPVRNPGVVPFVWERFPGRPKADGPCLDLPSAAPRLPPGRNLIEKEPASVAQSEKKLLEDEDEKQQHNQQSVSAAAECLDDEEEEKFSDALETLSRTESFFMNCSVSGLSEVPEKSEASGSFSTDPQVRDFMMGRFLPAAKAMTTGLPHTSSRKPPVQAREPMRVVQRVENGNQRRFQYPLNYQHGADLVQEGEGTSCSYDDDDDDDDDDEEDYYGNGHLSSKVCGLIPKFCLLNPVPEIKIPGRRLPPTSVRRIRGPQVKAMQHGSLGQADEEYSWEAVYNHKLMHGNPLPQVEDISKLMSESNHLTYWSDSPTADGSSPQCRSNNSGISPYRNEPSQFPFHEGKGFLGVPRRDRRGCKTDGSDSIEKDSENYWVVTPHHSNQCESGTMSPAVERTLHVETLHIPETPKSKSSSLGTSSDNKGKTQSADEDSEVGAQNQRKNESLVLETHDRDALQSKVTEIVVTGPTVCTESSACGVMVENNGFKPNDTDDSPLSLKEINQVKNDAYPKPSLLPLPLPNSPSESWLSRTLPSVSSKNPSAQSFLGIHFQPRKQASSSSSTVPKKKFPVKPSKAQCGQTRFSDMLAKPLSPQPEI